MKQNIFVASQICGLSAWFAIISTLVLWQSPKGNRVVTHWASLLRWIWSISEYDLTTRDSQHDQWKIWSGIVHHKSWLQNMCHTHNWPQHVLYRCQPSFLCEPTVNLYNPLTVYLTLQCELFFIIFSFNPIVPTIHTQKVFFNPYITVFKTKKDNINLLFYF